MNIDVQKYKNMSMEQVLESLIEEVASMSDEERFERIEQNGGFKFCGETKEKLKMEKWEPKKYTEQIIAYWQCPECGTKNDPPRSMENVNGADKVLRCSECGKNSEVSSYPSWDYDAELIEEES